MATGWRSYSSTDGSAPSLTGQTGSLITVLDAVLVNGYGSQSAAGSSPGAGAWSKAFSGTSKAAYRPSAGNQFYMRIQDDGPGVATFQEARIVGYEAMTTVDAGTNPMPTVAQAANGQFIRKSAAASSTARAWKCWADDRTVIFAAQTGDTASTWLCWYWGDFYSHLSADGYRTGLIARPTENSATTTTAVERFAVFGSSPVALTGHYVQRSRSGTVGAMQTGKNASVAGDSSTTAVGGNSTTMNYPNGEDGGLYLQPLYIFDPTTVPTNSVRGRYRGIWHNVHPASSFNDGDTFSGVGDYSGKSFLVVKTIGGVGVLIVETSDTVDVSS